MNKIIKIISSFNVRKGIHKKLSSRTLFFDRLQAWLTDLAEAYLINTLKFLKSNTQISGTTRVEFVLFDEKGMP